MERESELERIKELLKISPKGLSIEEVSKKLILNRATAAKYLNSLVMSGQADMRSLGPAKLFYLTHRLTLPNLLSLATDLILILDNDLFIQEANDQFLSCFHVSKADLKGKKIEHSPLAGYITGNHLDAIEKALEGQEQSFDVHFDNLEEDRFFKMKFIPFVFEGGEQAVVIILEDITEMKKYQQDLEEQVRQRTAELVKTNDALRESEYRFRQVTENAEEWIWEVNAEGMYRYSSQAVERILGYTPEELVLQKHFYDLFDPDVRDDLKKSALAIIEKKEPFYHFVNQNIHKNGSVVILEKSGSPILDDKGNLIGYRGTDMNITERKRAEDAIKKANKQIILLNSVTRHDVLNQLNTLTGYLGIMNKMHHDEKMAELIRTEQQVAETIRRQITFTRDYQNIGVQPPQWNKINDTMTKVLTTTDLGGVAVIVEKNTLEIYTDLLIEKVFFNLFDNSIRHGEHVTKIHISFRQDDTGVSIIYEDNGIGVPDQEKELIFDRGFGKNTGYGLFLVREILSITGLTIKESGIYEKGIRFEIFVPHGLYRFSS
ncbi:MAG: PAS domain S-box protein [Methanoregula sp.]|jgi:PAS domain S-box-containing protein|nr:PAS domain S-box protein [Methanoregula sp.]